MPDSISELARRLAENAETVCRHYLSNGRRHGRYWVVGNVHNTKGSSLYVRLSGPSCGKGAAGKWADAATGEHGDLLDLIQATQGLPDLSDAMDEAQRFLGIVGNNPGRVHQLSANASTSGGSVASTASDIAAVSQEAARRLWAASKSVAGTLAETYLRERGIMLDQDRSRSLRFHPRCFYRLSPDDPDGTRDAWPALIAAVTSIDGEMTGLHRIWLDPSGHTKAPVATPRRAMGYLLGNAVRFGVVAETDVMAAGEGIETVLSLRSVLPTMPMAAALSAGHLAFLLPPSSLRRLYIVRDNDPAGQRAADMLASRMREAGIEAIVLAPTLGDFNDDLRQLGPGTVAGTVRRQLVPEDVDRFWCASESLKRVK